MLKLVWSGGNTYYATILRNPQLKSSHQFEIKGLQNDSRVHALPNSLVVEGVEYNRAVVENVGVPI
mgnify:FL=1